MPFAERFSKVAFFPLPTTESTLEAWLRSQSEALRGVGSFAMVYGFAVGREQLREISEIVRIYGRVKVVVGASATGLIANQRELDHEPGFTVALFYLPETRAKAFHLRPEMLDGPDPAGVIAESLGGFRERANAWVLLASPTSLNSDAWLPDWSKAVGGKPTVGGFSAVNAADPQTLLIQDGEIHEEGAVALGLEGAVTLQPVVSQGCRPVGEIWTVTQAENNIIHQIGNRPILEVLRDTLETMSRRDQQRARGNIFIGVVHDEYKSRFGTGDFLVRNLAAIDPKRGSVAIATPLRVGQNLQFQIRDAHSAALDFEARLNRAAASLVGRRVYGACLNNCIGRGASLFGVPDHDTSLIQEAFPGIEVTGLSCNGEFGPVGERTLLHGYAASLGLFVDR